MEERMSENIERLVSNFNAASSAVHKAAGGKGGEGAEKKYGQAYQDLVKVGAKPQLKKRYR
jgi:hypothetical protein